MLSLHYHKLTRTTEKHEGRKYLTVDDYMLHKVLDKMKEIGLEQFDNTKFLIDKIDKLTDGNTLKKVVT